MYAMKSRDAAAFLAASLAVVLVIGLLLARHELSLNSFKAFYCGGSVSLSHANPYLVEPLRACEHRIYRSDDFPAFAVEPAPLPAYAIAAFMPLAKLPANTAHAIFLAALVAALIVTAWALAALTGFPEALVLLACAALWMLNVSYEELPPLAVAAIALCGLALARKRPELAAIAACAAMIQPHIGLPLCASLFVFVPRSRIVLIAGAAALLAIGFLATGAHTALAYFSVYLPGQAASEVVAADQYSLTNLLHVLGVGDRAALGLGSLSYLILALAGMIAGRRLADSTGEPAFMAFAPPAFVLLGGTFVHDIQMFAAMPLALLLLAKAPGHRTALAVGTAMMSTVWIAGDSRIALLFSLAAMIGISSLIFAGRPQRFAKAAAATLLLAAGVALVSHLPTRPFVVSPVSDAAAISPAAPASDAWNALLRSSPFLSEPDARSEGRKVPTWIALAILITVSLTQPTSEEEAAEAGAVRWA